MHIFNGNPTDLLKWPGIGISREFVCNLKNAPLKPKATYYDESHKWYLHSLQDIATSNSRRGIVTMFCPFGWDSNDATPSKAEYYAVYKKRMQDWARRFTGQPFVWIQLWNEPYAIFKSPADDALWLSTTADMVDNLRTGGWDGIIVVPGSSWGQDETVIERMGPQLLRGRRDIIFDIHAYEGWSAHPENIAARFAALNAKRLPFLIGEVGPVNQETYDPRPLLDMARTNRISVLAWIYADGNGSNSLLTHDYQPNNASNFNWGSTFKALLAEPH